MNIGPISAPRPTARPSAPDAAPAEHAAAAPEHTDDTGAKAQARDGVGHLDAPAANPHADHKAAKRAAEHADTDGGRTSVSKSLGEPRPTPEPEMGRLDADRGHTSVSKSLDRRVDELHHLEPR